MKLTLLCLLALGAATSAYRFRDVSSEQNEQGAQLAFAQPKHEYRFAYDVQLNTGYAPWISAQKASQRLQADVRIQFQSERAAFVRMENVRVGQRNDDVDSQRIQPLKAFDTNEIPSEQREQLERPVKFTISDGIVERIHFNKHEPVWSRNIKKAVIALIQLNQRKSVLELTKLSIEKNSNKQPRVYTVEEALLEGICQTTYTLTPISAQEFNVTKSIELEQCSQVADVAYGFHAAQSLKQIQDEQQLKGQSKSTESAKQNLLQPVPQEKLSRSTIYRFQIRKTSEDKLVLENSEVLSQYEVKSTNAESSMAMQTVAMGRLRLVDAQQKSTEKPSEQLDDEESIVYNSKAESDEKRFFMYGDEEFAKNPFDTKEEPESKRVEKVWTLIRKLTNEFNDKREKTEENELQITLEMQTPLAELRRLSIKSIQHLLEKSESETQKQVIFDLLAAAATHNPIKVLTERLNEMKTLKALKIIKSITGSLIAPSERIAQMVLNACNRLDKNEQSENEHVNAALKQSCWLSFGSIVGQLEHQQRHAAQSIEYPTRKEEQQTKQKLSEFAQQLREKFEQAQNTYEKVVALKAIGNAGLKEHLPLLEKLISQYNSKSSEQATVFIRTEAVGALRRMRFTEPARLQSILMPIFLDTKQKPELRMAALSTIVATLPAGPNDVKTLLGQVAFTLRNERSEQVRSFTYSLMQAYGKSPLPIEQEISSNLKNALKIGSIAEEEQLKRGSRHIRIPIYSQAEKEGVFLGANAVFSSSSLLPTHVSASIDSMLNGFVDKHAVYVSLCQNNAEQWIQRAIKQIKSSRAMRSMNNKASEEMRKLLQGIKVERRSSAEDEQSQEPFAMLNIRVKDVDQFVLPLTDRMVRHYDSEKLIELIQQVTETKAQSVAIFHEKLIRVPSSVGYPIFMSLSNPTIAHGQARAQVKVQKGHVKVELRINQASALVAQQQYMEVLSVVGNKERFTGVYSARALELQTPKNLEIHAEFSASNGLVLKTKTPAQKTEIFNIRTMPLTFVGRKVSFIENRQLAAQQREIKHQGENFRVSGYLHRLTSLTNPRELLKIVMTTENSLTINYTPAQEQEHRIRFNAEASIFKPAQIDEAQPEELQSFYNKERSVSSNEQDEESSESYEQRQKHANNYMSKYSERVSTHGTGNKAYKHSVKLIAESGSQKAEAQLQAVCDASFTGCRIELNAQRPAIQAWNENNEWKLKIKANTLMPERISSSSEESSEESKENKKSEMSRVEAHDAFITDLEAEWGTEREQKIKAHVAIRPQAHFPSEQVRVFMNQYELNAEYKLNKMSQHYVKRAYELFKAYYYMQSTSEPVRDRKSNSIQALIRIEPITCQYFNLTIQTPEERFRMESVRVPVSIRAPRIHAEHERRAAYHSVNAVMERLVDEHRTECVLTKKNLVQTFTEQQYRAPLSTRCYSVLAKDCKNVGEPAFVVMAKDSNEHKNKKIVKIVTSEHVIIAEPTSEGKLKLKWNGETVKAHQVPAENVDFNGQELYARMEGVSVRFDGERIRVRLSQAYNNAQCGLCGELNEQESQESEEQFLTAQNKRTGKLSEFHRSYSVQDDECTKDEQKNFYEQEDKFEVFESNEKRSYNLGSWESEEDEQNSQQSRSDEDESDEKENQKPEQKIKVVEFKHKMCFSLKPLNACRRSHYAQSEEKQQEQKAQFACFDRHSVEARRLHREALRSVGQPLSELAQQLNVEIQPTFVEVVRVPQRCQRV